MDLVYKDELFEAVYDIDSTEDTLSCTIYLTSHSGDGVASASSLTRRVGGYYFSHTFTFAGAHTIIIKNASNTTVSKQFVRVTNVALEEILDDINTRTTTIANDTNVNATEMSAALRHLVDINNYVSGLPDTTDNTLSVVNSIHNALDNSADLTSIENTLSSIQNTVNSSLSKINIIDNVVDSNADTLSTINTNTAGGSSGGSGGSGSTDLTDLENNVSSIKTTVESNATLLTDLNNDTGDIESDLSTLSTNLNTLTNTINTIKTAVNTLQTAMNGVSTNVSATNTTVNTIDTNVDEIVADVNSTQITVNNMSSTLNDVKTAVDNFDSGSTGTTVCNIEEVVNNIDSLVNDINTNTDTINTTLNGIDDTVNDIDTITTTINTNTSNTNNTVNTINTNINDIDSDLSTVNTTTSNIKTTVDNMKTTVNNTSTKVNEIDSNVDGIASTTSNINSNTTNINTTVNGLKTTLAGVDTDVASVKTTVESNATSLETLQESVDNLDVTNVTTDVSNIQTTVEAMSTVINTLSSTVSSDILSTQYFNDILSDTGLNLYAPQYVSFPEDSHVIDSYNSATLGDYVTNYAAIQLSTTEPMVIKSTRFWVARFRHTNGAESNPVVTFNIWSREGDMISDALWTSDEYTVSELTFVRTDNMTSSSSHLGGLDSSDYNLVDTYYVDVPINSVALQGEYALGMQLVSGDVVGIRRSSWEPNNWARTLLSSQQSIHYGSSSLSPSDIYWSMTLQMQWVPSSELYFKTLQDTTETISTHAEDTNTKVQSIPTDPLLESDSRLPSVGKFISTRDDHNGFFEGINH